MYYINLIINPLNHELMQNRRNIMIGMNSITIQNNTIVILYLDDEEHDSECLTSYGKLHGNTASDLHWLPHVVQPPQPCSRHRRRACVPPCSVLYNTVYPVTCYDSVIPYGYRAFTESFKMILLHFVRRTKA
jgi:hypothetical protein